MMRRCSPPMVPSRRRGSRLRRVEIDGVTVRDVEGMVLPAGSMSVSLLGMSFLSHLRSFRVEDGVLRLED